MVCFKTIFIIITICLLDYFKVVSKTTPEDHATSKKGDIPEHIGTVKFNNPHLLDISHNDEDGYYIDTSEDSPDPKQIGGIVIQDEVEKFASIFRKISNEELGVSAMQSIFDSLPYVEVKADTKVKLDELEETIWNKFDRILSVLRTIKFTLENIYSLRSRHPVSQRYDCCSIAKSELRFDEHYQTDVSHDTCCDLISHSAPPFAFNPGRNLTSVFQRNAQDIPGIKWQYFMSVDGIYNEFPAHNYPELSRSDCKKNLDLRHRDIFLATIHRQRKNVVIVLDQGISLSANQLHLAKSVAIHILHSLSENDRVGVIGLSADVAYPQAYGKLLDRLVTPTYESKLCLKTFIKKLTRKDTTTNHSLGFETAFQQFWDGLPKNKTARRENFMIIYISRGLLSSLTEAKDVLEKIAVENGKTGHRVVINSYAVIDEGKPIMYEKSFLQDLADQNFDKYLVEKKHSGIIPKGKMKAVNTTQDMSSIVGSFYKTFNLTISQKARISLPFTDDVGSGLLLAVTVPCFHDDQLLGVAGVDVYLGDIVEEFTYFSYGRNAYAFMLDKNGYVVNHPFLQRPIVSNQQAMYTDISLYEQHKGFKKVRSAILRKTEGLEVIEVQSADNSSHPNELQMQPAIKRIKYYWKHTVIDELGMAPFIVVIKVIEDGFKFTDIKSEHGAGHSHLVYHRLDLLPTDNTCMHLKQLATLDTSSLFLAAGAFNHPYEHLSQEETKRMVQGYLAYLNDNTNLISNPGVKDEIKKAVGALSRINEKWLLMYEHSRLKEYIVRRYVATPNGAMQIFPGTLINKLYDPTRTDWYTRALQYPGKVTLTVPYLDVGGAGYIVTISHTVYEGKNAAFHGPFDRAVAVMGMDVTLGYVYKMLTEEIPLCHHQHIRCFIMDERGYLIAHQGLIEPNGRGPLEQQHITHQEPLVANDILKHKDFVLKKLCNRFVDRTVQRFYHFNTSINRVLTNLVHGEHCSRYQVALIPGTNTFLGILNQTCSMNRAFCPCSMVDRLCLNCHRMEQTECECPCECPLQVEFFTGKLIKEDSRNPSCVRYPERIDLVEITPEVKKVLPQCFQSKCPHRKTKSACLGVVDCEWCYYDQDGTTVLKQPFCSDQRVCFAGVLGAATPYNDGIVHQLKEETTTVQSTPVGPVAGGIMACFLLLALAVYCYRHHVHNNSHHYVSTAPDSTLRGSNIDNELEDLDISDDPASGHTNTLVLASFENPASISPYRINTQYRRPTHVESDHGYSTMTPQEDSEHASTTCIEPLIAGRDRYRPPPHSVVKASGTTPALPPPPGRVTSTTTPTPHVTYCPIPEQNSVAPQTVLPDSSPNRVLASVQVHMVDTH